MADTKPITATEPAVAEDAERLPPFPPEVLARAQEHAPRLLDALGAWLGLEKELARPDITAINKASLAVHLVTAKRRAGQIVAQVVNG